MTMHLRDLPDGTRFVLLRTGEKYRLLRRGERFGCWCNIVQRDGDEQESSLHHACHVKPIVRADGCHA